jgi:hypothetical protein
MVEVTVRLKLTLSLVAAAYFFNHCKCHVSYCSMVMVVLWILIEIGILGFIHIRQREMTSTVLWLSLIRCTGGKAV